MATVSTVLDHFHILQRAGGKWSATLPFGPNARDGNDDSVLGNDSRGTITGGLRMSFFINQGVYLCNKPNETCKIITPPSAAILKDLENLRSTVPKCQHTKGMSTAKNPNTCKKLISTQTGI
uniref:Uncharacterized protein n=1 Tax=Coccidioides posadasii RMSCC 3488 TaxID=454284 RepID=A0A0J6FQI6_COCPO|nr:hypothetical protein CPAG_08933 [Coccidioides posadasii RMSCC 3488]